MTTDSEAVFRRDGDFWTVAFDGQVSRLKDSRGLFYIAYLLRHPGRDIHTTDLITAAQGGVGPTVNRRTAGAVPELERRSRREADGDVLLDPQAKAAYRGRLAELNEELEEAQELNDLGRAERARHEIDLIARELSAAVGLGGRDRTAPNDSERARIAVTKATTLALKMIGEHNAILRQYLGRTLKMGRLCSYTPDSRSPVTWTL